MATPNRKAPNPVDVHVGQRMQARRLSLGMNQQSLGDALGVVVSQVQRYEKGECRLYAAQIHKLSVILRVSPAHFFNGAPVRASIRAPQTGDAATVCVAEFLATKDGEAIMVACSRIRDQKARHIIRNHIEDLAGALAGP